MLGKPCHVIHKLFHTHNGCCSQQGYQIMLNSIKNKWKTKRKTKFSLNYHDNDAIHTKFVTDFSDRLIMVGLLLLL